MNHVAPEPIELRFENRDQFSDQIEGFLIVGIPFRDILNTTSSLDVPRVLRDGGQEADAELHGPAGDMLAFSAG
jgi:hypothetical protein